MNKRNNHSVFKVLIIEDEMDTCYLLNIILKRNNFSAHAVSTLADAKIALNDNKPSLIFLDNHLPDGWGIDFIDFIKY